MTTTWCLLCGCQVDPDEAYLTDYENAYVCDDCLPEYREKADEAQRIIDDWPDLPLTVKERFRAKWRAERRMNEP